MTESQPDFTFNEKTGELSRGGKVMTLPETHRRLFAALWRFRRTGDAVRVSVLAELFGCSHSSVSSAAKRLDAKLKELGLTIGYAAGGKYDGYKIQVGSLPKWQPDIPPPVILESSR